MTVIGDFSVALRVHRWKLDEEPPAAAIGAGSIPFGGLLKINTTTYRGFQVHEREIAVLVLSRSHFQHADDFDTTARMASSALRYSSPLRFCADLREVTATVVEELYRMYDMRPALLTGEDTAKVVLEIDLQFWFPEEEEEGQMPVDNFDDEYEFVKVPVPWRVGENFMGNLRRCVGLSGDGDIDDVWEVKQFQEGLNDDDAVAAATLPES